MPLDSIITYGHIKEWVSETLGYSHWQQVPAHFKTLILTARVRTYPSWEDIQIMPLNEGG